MSSLVVKVPASLLPEGELSPDECAEQERLELALSTAQAPVRARGERKPNGGYQAWFGFPPAKGTQPLASGPFLAVSRLPRRRSLRDWSRPAVALSVASDAPTSSPAPEPSHPFPHLPEGLELEGEDSVRALATMVVAYHGTVPMPLQSEFVRQIMKFAGETAGRLIQQAQTP